MKTTDKHEFTEYTLKHRYDIHHGSNDGEKTGWMDGTGWNNTTRTYNHLSQVRAQITRSRRYLERHYTGVEFRVLSRRVTRTDWAEAFDA